MILSIPDHHFTSWCELQSFAVASGFHQPQDWHSRLCYMTMLNKMGELL